MALTFLTAPQPLVPAYNPIPFTFSGTNNTFTGYRYLLDIYSGNSLNIIARLKVTPTQFGDGYVDISRILNNFVSVDFDPTSSSDSNASNSFFPYSVNLGEEYMFQWPYRIVTSASTGPFNRQVILSGSPTGATHVYTAGDQIEVITVTSGATAVVNGLHTVVTATPTTVTLDIIYPSTATATTLNISGNTTYADKRNIPFTGLSTLLGFSVFNGALDWPQWKGWEDADYTHNLTVPDQSVRLLSSFNRLGNIALNENRFYATPAQNFWFNFFTATPNSAHTVTAHLINQNGTTAATSNLVITNTFSGQCKQFRVGFTFAGFSPTQGQSLKFYLRNNAGQQIGAAYFIYADTRCKREDIILYYMDRFGSILSQSFPLNSTEAISIDRDTIKKAIIYPPNPLLDLTQAGSVNVNVDITRSFTLQTNWLTQGNIDLMEELVSSRYVWIFEGGVIVPVIVQDGGYEITQQRNKRLQRKTITVQLANQQPIN